MRGVYIKPVKMSQKKASCSIHSRLEMRSSYTLKKIMYRDSGRERERQCLIHYLMNIESLNNEEWELQD